MHSQDHHRLSLMLDQVHNGIRPALWQDHSYPRMEDLLQSHHTCRPQEDSRKDRILLGTHSPQDRSLQY